MSAEMGASVALPTMLRYGIQEDRQDNFKTVTPGVFRKDVIRTGTWWTSGGKAIEVTPERMDRWCERFRVMKAAGIKVDAPYDHSDDSRDNAGFVRAMERIGDTLYVELEVPRAEDQNRIGSTVTEVSLSVNPAFVAGDGKNYGECIEHVAPCTRARVSGQSNFERLAARSGAVPDGIVFLRKGGTDMGFREDVCALAGCDPSCTDEALLAALKEKLGGQEKTALRQAKSERDQAIARCTKLDGEVTQLRSEVETLRAGKPGQDKEPKDPEVLQLRADLDRMIGEGAESKVAQLKAEGKLLPAMEEDARLLLTSGRRVQLRSGDKPVNAAGAFERIMATLPRGAALDLTERTKLRAIENPGREAEEKPEDRVARGKKLAGMVQP